jgi:hypothetical protein
MSNLVSAFPEWLNSNQWLNMVFLLLALLSIVISIIFYYRSRVRIIPCYQIRNFPLITANVQKVEGLQVLHNGTPIENLTATHLSFWNQGNATLNSDDVAPHDPIRLNFSQDAKPLQVTMLHASKSANNASAFINSNDNSVHIKFDYFHTGEGLVCQIYHTGSEDNEVSLLGTVKSAKIKHAEQYDDPITDGLVGPLIKRVHNSIKKYGEWTKFVIFVIFLPVVVFTLPVDLIVKPFTKLRRIPREFDIAGKQK